MDNDRDKLIDAIFCKARELENREDRIAYIKEACAGNDDLRAEVEAMLRADVKAEKFFDRRLASEAVTGIELPREGPGTVIGRFKLLEQFGEGGMGVVYMAEQEQPLRRKVALKIIKLGMDTKQVVARFEAERQALALMDHPNIAKVLDAGATESGRPYFVMELVRGIPISRFCEERKLSFEARLKLFMDVCEAIRHAHQKGIIHRDLKPSNILVTLHGEKAVPKVIDFGIAKATQQRLTEKTLFTGFSQMIGTPAYMSPEQAEMSEIEVDTRTDVYSLGVLLYELLTGTTPFSDEQLRSAGYVEMQRIIRNEEPEKPSTRLTKLRRTGVTPVKGSAGVPPAESGVSPDSSGQNSNSGTGAFGETPKAARETQALPNSIPPDLDWIVMMALAKDPDRRYESTSAFADDLQRFLENQPVRAAAPSRIYTARKFIRRHRGMVLASASVVAALMIGLVVATFALIQAGKERDRALTAETETQRQIEVAEAVIDFFVKDILRAGDVWTATQTPKSDLTIWEVLGQAAKNIDERFPDQPLVEATVRLYLGKTFGESENSIDAISNLRRAHDLFLYERGSKHPDTLKSKRELGWMLSLYYHSEEDVKEGESLLIESYQGRLEVLGREHPDTLEVMSMLGLHYVNHGDYIAAEHYLQDAREIAEVVLPREHQVNQTINFSLSYLRFSQQRYAEAFRMNEQRLEIYLNQYGEHDLRVANDLIDIGHYLWWWNGDFTEANQMLVNALKTSRDLVENKVPTPNILYELASMHLAQQKFEPAIQVLRELLEAELATLGSAHSETHKTISMILETLGRQAAWDDLIAETMKLRQSGFMSANLLVAELLTLQLAGKTNPVEVSKNEFWERYLEDPESMSTFQNALILSVLPLTENELPQLVDLTQRVESRFRPDQWRQTQADLLRGINEYQGGNLESALVTFSTITFGEDLRPLGPVVKYFTALTHFQLGNRVLAEESLQVANTQLSNYLRLGDLSPPASQSDLWVSLAVCLLLRDQTEQAISGAIIPKPVTQESLAEFRENWKEIQALLKKADEAGRDRDYQRAEQIYRELWQHPKFNLESVVIEDSALGRKRLAALANLGKWDECFEFLDEFYELMAYSNIPDGLQLLSIPKPLPPNLANRVHGSADVKRDLFNETTGQPDYWAHLSHGLARYREGDYEGAKELLRVTMEPAHYYHELMGKLFTAMADYHLGNFNEAEALFLEVESDFNQMLEFGEGRFDPTWYGQGLIELNLKEARALMNDIL